MYSGYTYKSGIKFVRALTSFADALAAYNAGEKICVNYFPGKPSRVIGPFFVPTEQNKYAFEGIGKKSVWFVADVPAGYVLENEIAAALADLNSLPK